MGGLQCHSRRGWGWNGVSKLKTGRERTPLIVYTLEWGEQWGNEEKMAQPSVSY